ncbi:MAG: FN3 associated domain-containing protein, partial [Angelakisella sp.]
SAVDLSGKKAALMVYRGTNSDPTKDQLEYVGETTIGAGNTYSISFPAKSGAPTKDTGDYIVTLGVEGATNLYNIEIIKAPVTSYTVTFYDGDGKPIGEPLSVEEGKSATAPEAPVKTGHRFLKWDKGFTNVSKDIAVTAIYEKEKFTVAFVDWQNDTLVLQDAEYGSSLAAPAGKSSEGYTFTSWDKDVTNVTSSMVVTAQYAPKVFNVTFARAIQNDNTILPADIISEQQIKYGESAALPAPIAEEGKVFRGWSTNVCWWKVESDVVVTPIFEYAETTMQPVTDKGSIVTGMQDEIELVAEEGAKIYYTTDGSEPTEPAASGSVDASDTSNTTKEYTGPIPVTESTVIKAISVAPKKNISEVMEVVFVYDDDDYDDDEVPEEKVEIATYPVIAEAGKEITLELLIENNPGISMYQFFIECDTNVFYAKCDNVSGDYLAQTGEVSKNGSLLLAPYENKGWTAIWFSPLNTEMNGKLLSIKLGVTDGVTTGEHPIKISYSPKNTCTIDYEEKALDGIGVQVLNDSGKLMGDANGDKRVNLADAVRIARYIVALSDIPEARRFAADVNRDNQITIADAICIARHVAGIELMK